MVSRFGSQLRDELIDLKRRSEILRLPLSMGDSESIHSHIPIYRKGMFKVFQVLQWKAKVRLS